MLVFTLLTNFLNIIVLLTLKIITQETVNRILSPDFKTTSCPVIIDFLIRHGIINPENGELNIYI